MSTLIPRRSNLIPGAAGWMLAERKGNVAVITALMLLILVFVLGIGVDYTLARQKQSQIDGFADSAVLAAVSPQMMSQSWEVAQATATNVFLAQLATMNNVQYSPSDVKVVVTDTPAGLQNKRVATLVYTAKSPNLFASIIGLPTLPVGGTSTSTSGLSPSINFYMLIDTSPSMEIAATTAGITTLMGATSAKVGATQDDPAGCGFGCHETDNPNKLNNPSKVHCADGTIQFPKGGEDNYALARCLGVTMRIDLVNLAVQNLMTLAPSVAASNRTNYQVALYTVDVKLTTLQAMTSNFPAAQTAAANIAPLTVYANNYLTSSNKNQDEDSALDLGLQTLYNTMPVPGNGTQNKGDKPQEVLFIISDAMDDYGTSNGSRLIAPISTAKGQDWCTSIKNQGIRIAFLYLTYNPLPDDQYYQDNVASIQPNVAIAAQKCASTGLYFEVNTDGDVSAALNALFQQAVATAYLSK